MTTAPPYRLRSARSDARGFAQIAELFSYACGMKQSHIDVDCSSVAWFDANLAAALGAIAKLLKDGEGKTIRLTGLRPSIEEILCCNGLLGTSRIRRRPTVVPLRQFVPGDARKFAGYTQDHLSNKGIPSMSAQVERRFFEGIDELFQNGEIHSQTKFGMFACGQLYPRTNRLDFSLVDLGLGFEEVVFRGTGKRMAPADAITWGMTGSNTTRSGDVPGGLGLKILKEFITLNGGRLSVVSQRGYWCLHKNGVIKSEFEVPFPGTAVTLEVNTGDRSAYRMKHEIDPASVF